MDRRSFLIGGIGSALAAGSATAAPGAPAPEAPTPAAQPGSDRLRAAFPRLADEIYLNAAGATPLASFAEAGIERYLELVRAGPGGGRRAYFDEVLDGVRGRFADLIGARASEIALVHCTKAGEQVVLDGLDAIDRGGNVVTNDLHFGGSLHNLEGLRRAGVDVRIVRHRDWQVAVERMAEAIDARTALLAVTLVSNVNGHVEPMRALADLAHRHGAVVYADIIQAAGIVPIDVHALGIDCAAANGYKWLYGVHGAGFLFVRHELQGGRLRDRVFPGHVRFNYEPWVDDPDPDLPAIGYRPPQDARRYQPGHLNYLGYCAVYEGLRFLNRVGVEDALAHSMALNRRLRDRLDRARFPCITPPDARTPIAAFHCDDPAAVRERLAAAGITVAFGPSYLRVSPALYNREADVDALAAALAG